VGSSTVHGQMLELDARPPPSTAVFRDINSKIFF